MEDFTKFDYENSVCPHMVQLLIKGKYFSRQAIIGCDAQYTIDRVCKYKEEKTPHKDGLKGRKACLLYDRSVKQQSRI